jgi:3-oxoacyl-[acyl-carrier protein] reductase
VTRRLEGRVVLVTGGSRGLGRAISLGCAREGASVFVGYRRREREALECVDRARELGAVHAEAVALDVREPRTVEDAVRRVTDGAGRLDGLVTSAGIVADGWLATLPSEQWDDVVRTNLSGTMHAIKACLRPMMAQKAGAIVALASVAGLKASPGQAAYAASKGGILAMVRTVAVEAARHGVRVNALAPGLFDAGMVKATPRERLAATIAHIPLGRLGTDEELARAALFLLSDDASYVTGQTLVVDGGLSA